MPQRRRDQERHELLEDRRVGGDLEVMREDERQPDAIVGEPRPDALPGRRMPPVLDVALDELPRRGAEQVGPGQRRFGVDQGHRILQLIPEPVRPAALVQCRTGPHPAGERLVQGPAIEHGVEAGLGVTGTIFTLYERENDEIPF